MAAQGWRRLPGEPGARQVDPVATLRGTVGSRHDVLEHATAAFDRPCGCDIVVIARDQHASDADGTRDDHGLAQDLGGVPETPVCRQHAIAEVATLAAQESR